MKVGIDLDDVLIKTADTITGLFKKIYGIDLDFNYINDYSIEKSFNVSKQRAEQVVKMALESDMIEPEPNAIKMFNWISDLYSTFIVSRRESYLYQHTAKTLDRLGFKSYRLITFHENDNGNVPHYKDKHEIVNKYGLDLFIEDRPSTIENIYKHTEANILVYDKPWNQEFRDDYRLKRVFSWIEIRDYILWSTYEYKDKQQKS